MAVPIVNFEIPQGNDREIRVPVIDKGTNELADLTGFKAWFTAKKKYSDPDEEAKISKELAPNTFSNPIIFDITNEDTDIPLNEKGYDYDVKVKTDTGEIYTVVKGKLKITWTATKDKE